MKRFLFVTALAVLACTAVGAEPTPARRSALLLPVPAPAEALGDTSITPMKAQSFNTQAPACTTQAPSCTTLLPAPAQAPTCAAQAPTCAAQAPSCGVEAHVCDRCEMEVCICRRSYAPGKFLVNEFVRRPVYGVQKAMNDGEARRLCRQECRLEAEAEALAAHGARIHGRVACDRGAKASIIRSEVIYANKVNRHILKRAELEAKQEANALKAESLRAKHMDLFN